MEFAPQLSQSHGTTTFYSTQLLTRVSWAFFQPQNFFILILLIHMESSIFFQGDGIPFSISSSNCLLIPSSTTSLSFTFWMLPDLVYLVDFSRIKPPRSAEFSGIRHQQIIKPPCARGSFRRSRSWCSPSTVCIFWGRGIIQRWPSSL